MIPKIIHYCWFGHGDKGTLAERCIDSWPIVNPDYKIILWDERNVNFDTPFLKSAAEKKQWAFVSDYIRHLVLHEYGGIYLDTDVEVIRPFDDLLNEKCFIGLEAEGRLGAGVIGCEKGHEFPRECMLNIDSRFENKKAFLIAPEIATKVHADNPGLKITVLDQDSFYPYNPYDVHRDRKNFMYSYVTEETYAVHHWGKSWEMSMIARIKRKLWSCGIKLFP